MTPDIPQDMPIGSLDPGCIKIASENISQTHEVKKTYLGHVNALWSIQRLRK